MNEAGGTVARGLALVAERIAALPGALEAAAREPLPSTARLGAGPFAVTGAGGSEGPARVLSDQLARHGVPARFVPLSAFAGSAPPVSADDRLVIVSQGLSPNARLALAHRDRVACIAVVTATRPDPQGSEGPRTLADATDEGHLIFPHGPTSEGELLVRILGPALATLVVLRLAAQITGEALDVSGVAGLVTRALDSAPEAELGAGATTALVVAGDGGASAHGLRWKILEALDLGDPPVWDVLQFAHGPLQQYFDRPATLITLERNDPSHAQLFDRLAAIARPHHRLIRLRATQPGPLAWFEHDAMLDVLVARALRRSPRDLVQWPGKGQDGALYAIARPLED